MPKLKHIHIEGYPYFVTTTTANIKAFSDTKLADILLSCIYYGRNSGWYLLLSFIIMPDHLHIIVVPRSKNISQIMKGIKGYSSKLINLNAQNKKPVWQAGFYDYILDSEDNLLTKIKYIQNNPVKEGLVLEPESYLYSSVRKQNSTDLDMYLGNIVAGQECPAYP